MLGKKTDISKKNFKFHAVVYNLCRLISNDKHLNKNKKKRKKGTRARTDGQTSSVKYLSGRINSSPGPKTGRWSPQRCPVTVA